MKLDLTPFPRLSNGATIRLLCVFKEANIPIRFVGGCIRDALLKINAYDIDLAVPIPPQEAIRVLSKAGIKVIPTGIDYGTVTAIVDKHPYQITSLRTDWGSTGRHTEVHYGTDWKTDAERRDFTFNALYADPDGTLYDFFDGANDIKKGHVKFIGDPKQRIQEDYLRILRFFRFYAWYGRGHLDEPALEACSALKDGLKHLSRERIRHEFLKMLAAPNPLPALQGMSQAGILPYVLSEEITLGTLKSLLRLEETYSIPPSALRRLMALLITASSFAALTEELKLSRHEERYLKECLEKHSLYPAQESDRVERLYYDGNELFIDMTLLSESSRFSESSQSLQTTLSMAQNWKKPLFPLSGTDLMEMGLRKGPQIGELLKGCETWWIRQLPHPAKEDCLQWAREHAFAS